MPANVTHGGTGAPTAAGARINLGLGPANSPTFTNLTLSGNLSVTGTATFGAATFTSFTVPDNGLSITGSADATKVLKFEVDGFTTGTTRTITIPNASTTMVGTDTIQTLTNKTINVSQLTGTLGVANGGTGATTFTGILVGNGISAVIARSLTGTANELTVVNGNGVSGNPTISLPTALTFTGKTVTGGTFNSGTFSGDGSSLTALNATQLTSGTVPVARLSGSYTGVTGTGALNAGSITSGFGSINIGASSITGGAFTGTIGTFTTRVVGGTGTVTTATSADQVVAVGASVTGLLIENTNIAGSGFITFGDGAIAGRITYDHSTNAMSFTTGGTLAATLTSSGSFSLVTSLSAPLGTFTTTAVNGIPLEIISTEAAASFGPEFSIFRNSATPSSNDNIGAIGFYGNNNGAAKTRLSQIYSSIGNVGAGVEIGQLTFTNKSGGSDITPLFLDGPVVSLPQGQLKFPAVQNASTDVNTLDDYEEGTFTPRIDGTTTAGLGTYTTQLGDYVKIGKVVYFNIVIVWTAHTGTGNIVVANLPFTVGGDSFTSTVEYSNLTYTNTVFGLAQTTTTNILIRSAATGGVVAGIAMDTAATLRVTGFYFV